jgi:cyclopropane fatty-acyl-phospholipid synthase-like methyltransferase
MPTHINSILSRNPILDATMHDFNQTLRFQYITKNVKQLTKAKLNAKILDVGAGRGTLTNYLTAKLNCKTINLETNKQEKTKDLIVANGTHLPFIDSAFDVAISSDVLEHINASNRGCFLGSFCAVQKPGSYWTFSRIHTRNPQRSAIRIFERLSRSEPEWYREHNSCDLVAPNEVVEELMRNKASRISVEPIVGFSAVAATGLIQNIPWRAHLRASANILAYFAVKLTDREPYYGFGVTATKNRRKVEAA